MCHPPPPLRRDALGLPSALQLLPASETDSVAASIAFLSDESRSRGKHSRTREAILSQSIFSSRARGTASGVPGGTEVAVSAVERKQGGAILSQSIFSSRARGVTPQAAAGGGGGAGISGRAAEGGGDGAGTSGCRGVGNSGNNRLFPVQQATDSFSLPAGLRGVRAPPLAPGVVAAASLTQPPPRPADLLPQRTSGGVVADGGPAHPPAAAPLPQRPPPGAAALAAAEALRRQKPRTSAQLALRPGQGTYLLASPGRAAGSGGAAGQGRAASGGAGSGTGSGTAAKRSLKDKAELLAKRQRLGGMQLQLGGVK